VALWVFQEDKIRNKHEDKIKVRRLKAAAGREHKLDMGYEVRCSYLRIKEDRKISKRQHLVGEPAPLEEAIKEVAEKYHKGIHTVKNAYDEYKIILKSYKEEPQKMGK